MSGNLLFILCLLQPTSFYSHPPIVKTAFSSTILYSVKDLSINSINRLV